MKFYKDAPLVWSILFDCFLGDIFLFALWIKDARMGGLLLFFLLFTLFELLSLRTEKVVYIDKEKILCMSGKKELFSCKWEDVQSLKRCHHYRNLSVDIVLKDGADAHINYLVIASEPNFYFWLTPRSKKIIKKYCPDPDLARQIDRRHSRSK